MGNTLSELIQIKYIVASLLYSGIGLIMFVIGFIVLDLLTPKVSIWKELVEKQNVAVAIFLAGTTIGIAMIIASSIHG